MDSRVQAVLDFMRINLHRNLSIDDLARSVELSRSRLFILFKTEVGTSPMQHLKTLRMQKAHELLKTSLLGVKEIAGKVGYNDDSHFMRDFKKTYRLTPSEHRANYLPLILNKD